MNVHRARVGRSALLWEGAGVAPSLLRGPGSQALPLGWRWHQLLMHSWVQAGRVWCPKHRHRLLLSGLQAHGRQGRRLCSQAHIVLRCGLLRVHRANAAHHGLLQRLARRGRRHSSVISAAIFGSCAGRGIPRQLQQDS